MNSTKVLCLAILCLCIGCASSKLSPHTAREVIARDLGLSEEQVSVDEKMGTLGGAVSVEASLKLSFVLQQGQDGRWHVYKVQYSNGQWQTLDQFKQSLLAAFHSELQK